jgi:hypothetical protein
MGVSDEEQDGGKGSHSTGDIREGGLAMKKQWLIGVVALWVVSIAVAGFIGWNLGSAGGLPVERETGEEPVSTVPAPRAEERLRQEPAPTVAELERENAQLREELAGLKDEVQKAASDFLMYAISQALQDAARKEVTTQQVEATWNRGMKAIERAAADSFFGIGAIGDVLALTAEIALMGEEGIRCLGEIARDTGRTTEERRDALEILAHMPHKLALETIMEMPDPESFGMYFPYNAIEGPLLKLPTADIQEYIPQIRRYLSSTIAADRFEGELAAILAFLHEDAFCSSLLHDPHVWHEELDRVFLAANYIHTERAREFLEEVRRTHSNEEFCTRAAEMLDNW